MVTGRQPGGQLTTTTRVDNFPGFPDGIDGAELMERMTQQAQRFGTRFMEGEVTRVELGATPLRLWIEDQALQCRTLIIATGASPRLLGLPNERELYGRGVSVCATCDGFFYRDKQVVVVGGGDTAMEEAIFLTHFATKVTVVHRRDQLRASAALAQRARENPKIDFCWDSRVVAILGDSQTGVTGVRLRHLPSDTERDLACDGLFVAIGHAPNTTLFQNQLEQDEGGYLVTRNGTETNIAGVFAAGDVQDSHFRQAVTAAGTGCMAALQAERYLDSHNN
ncbi:MAG: thioredoxin-disulfide reductase [Desulfuromonadaceae bacterium]